MGPLCAMPPLLLLLLLELLHEAGQGPPDPLTRRDWAQPWGSLSPVGGRVWSQITVPQQLGANTKGVAGLKQARCWGGSGEAGRREGRRGLGEYRCGGSCEDVTRAELPAPRWLYPVCAPPLVSTAGIPWIVLFPTPCSQFSPSLLFCMHKDAESYILRIEGRPYTIHLQQQ